MSKLTADILESIVDEAAGATTETSSDTPTPKTEEKSAPPPDKGTVITETAKDAGGEAKTSTDAKEEGTSSGSIPGDSQTATTAKADEVKAPPPASFKVKVDGEEQEVDQEELIRGYQLARTSHKRFQEASQYKKDADRIIEALDKNPLQTALQRIESRFNGDTERAEKELYKLCLQYVEPFVMAKQMPEDEREAFEDRRRIDRERRALETEKARVQREKDERTVKEHEEKFTRELKASFQKHKLPFEDAEVRSLFVKHANDAFIPFGPFEAEDAVASFKSVYDRRVSALKPATAVAPKPPVPTNGTSTAQATTPKPFPSTKTDGEAAPAKERERKPAAFTNTRDFHRALLSELGAS